MRLFMSLGFGLSFAFFAVPALAGNVAAGSFAYSSNYQMEKGVKVYRAQPTARLNQNQLAHLAQERRTAEIKAKKRAWAQKRAVQSRATEKAYERGFAKGFAAAQKQSVNRRSYSRNRYNYGRRYVTSRHSLFSRPLYRGYR